jgi:phosphate transport system permease protein
VPLSAVVAVLTARRSTRRQGVVTGGVVFLLAAGVSQLAAFVGITPATAQLYLLAVSVPAVTYGQRTLDEGEGVSGLALPVLLVAGSLAGAAVVRAFDFSAPNPWLDPSFLSGIADPVPEATGFFPAIVGSILVISMVAVFSFVLGVGTAVFLEEYTPDSGPIATLTRLIQINIANLAAVPSVVYGLLGLGVFINLIGFGIGTAVTAAITLSLLILPITVISAQEAIRSVPDSLRNGSYAMGATRWQTTKNVVLPEAFSGILTGTILALGRAIGETAPLIMIGAPSVVFSAPESISDKIAAMPMQIFVWSSSAKTEFQYGVLAAGVVTLLAVLLALNGTAIILRNRSERE